MSKTNAGVVVAVPVQNEEDRIGECLRALALQDDNQTHGILLFLNDCNDGTADIVRALIPSLPVPVEIIEASLVAAKGHAGIARAAAMEFAAARAGTDGVVMTTDADGRVCSDWIEANLWHLRNGADAVAGRAEIDPLEGASIPQHLHDADADETAYAAALDELTCLLDPDSADPWPRHCEDSGASIAVTVEAYRRAGGVPPVALGEDRAFIEALRRIDARIRHASEIRVTVSGRIVGRAKGGMADTIRRRLSRPDDLLDDRLEPFDDLVRRVTLRRAFRCLWVKDFANERALEAFAAKIWLAPEFLRDVMPLPYFGSAWAALEAESPLLSRTRVPVCVLSQEMNRAQDLLSILRDRATIRPRAPADRDDIPAADTAERA